MKAAPGMRRRNFFKLVGSGIVIFVGLDSLPALSQDPRRI